MKGTSRVGGRENKAARPVGSGKTVRPVRPAIMDNEKEKAEHITIVDLIRNDIGMAAQWVEVPRFRVVSEVETGGENLLQVSSEVRGFLGAKWKDCLGQLLVGLLPAGSVTGAPKARTCQILREAENYERHWYTGVFGVFDGQAVDSCVMIRFVQQDGQDRQHEQGLESLELSGGAHSECVRTECAPAERVSEPEPLHKLLYKSGGGITIYSNAQLEYQELKDKVYVPFAH